MSEKTVELSKAISAATSFFAALMGYGLSHLIGVQDNVPQRGYWLSHLLGVKDNASPNLYHFKIPCFMIALMLFFRFMIGSANHLNEEHGLTIRQEGGRHFIWDIFSFAAYGFFGLLACYSQSVPWFLIWISVFLFFAVIWFFVDIFCFGKSWEERGKWLPWLIIDIIQCIVFLWFGIWMSGRNPQMHILHAIFRILVGVSGLFLFVDLGFQFDAFRSKTNRWCMGQYRAFQWGKNLLVVAYGRHTTGDWSSILKGDCTGFKMEYKNALNAEPEFLVVRIVPCAGEVQNVNIQDYKHNNNNPMRVTVERLMWRSEPIPDNSKMLFNYWE